MRMYRATFSNGEDYLIPAGSRGQAYVKGYELDEIIGAVLINMEEV